MGELDLDDSNMGLQDSPSVKSKPSSKAHSPYREDRQKYQSVDKRLELEKMTTTEHHLGVFMQH